MHLRDPAVVVKRQMEHASVMDRNFYFTPWRGQDRDGKRMRSHPMSADHASRILRQVTRMVMENGAWADEKSFMAMLQLYSDKSSMNLSTKSQSVYPLHVAVKNLRSDVKDSLVKKCETVVAYLSTCAKWLPIPEDVQKK